MQINAYNDKNKKNQQEKKTFIAFLLKLKEK